MKELPKMTLADHAEAWTKEKGESVPPRDTTEWRAMYERWHSFAFAEFTVNRGSKMA